MSRMFDALRRAEEARRRKAEGDSGKPAVEPSAMEPLRDPGLRVESPARPAPNGNIDFSEDLFRELGILRNSIETLLGRKSRRSILFTGSTAEEGTTTLATSFAALLASQAERRVLLVELNARRPSFTWRLGLNSEEGVTEYLTQGRPLSSVVQRSRNGLIDVVSVGEKDPVAIQKYVETGLGRLLEEAGRTYDTVIVDAPPVVTSPETPPMTALVDGVVLVVQCERTKREVVQRSLSMISQFEGNILGVVLNRKKYYIPDFIYRRL